MVSGNTPGVAGASDPTERLMSLADDAATEAYVNGQSDSIDAKSESDAYFKNAVQKLTRHSHDLSNRPTLRHTI